MLDKGNFLFLYQNDLVNKLVLFLIDLGESHHSVRDKTHLFNYVEYNEPLSVKTEIENSSSVSVGV